MEVKLYSKKINILQKQKLISKLQNYWQRLSSRNLMMYQKKYRHQFGSNFSTF